MKAERAFTLLASAIREKGTPICQEVDGELWFPEIGGESYELRMAKKLCSTCPVQRECAVYALAADEAYGIWGGLTPHQRNEIRKGKTTLEKALGQNAVRVERFKLGAIR